MAISLSIKLSSVPKSTRTSTIANSARKEIEAGWQKQFWGVKSSLVSLTEATGSRRCTCTRSHRAPGNKMQRLSAVDAESLSDLPAAFFWRRMSVTKLHQLLNLGRGCWLGGRWNRPEGDRMDRSTSWGSCRPLLHFSLFQPVVNPDGEVHQRLQRIWLIPRGQLVLYPFRESSHKSRFESQVIPATLGGKNPEFDGELSDWLGLLA